MKKVQPLLLCLIVTSALAAPRTWTDTQGRSLQAEYISSDAVTVTLRIAGKEHQIPITRFSPADQAWIAQQKGSSTAAASAAAIPPMTQRQIAEFLYKERAASRPTINVMAGKKFVRTSAPQELPAEDFYVHSILELVERPEPFPWPLLQQMPKLMDLTFSSSSPITASEIVHLNALTSPFSIQIRGEAKLDSAAVAAFPRLTTLKLLAIPANLVDEKDLPILASRCPTIETFIVRHPGEASKPPVITDQALTATLPLWKDLKHLYLNRIPFSARTATAATSCRGLKQLTLEACGQLAVQDFAPLAAMKSLKEVRILFNKNLTPADTQALQQSLKNCEVSFK